MTARAEIDAAAIRHNVEALGACAPGSQRCAVVKADGYGHGAAVVAAAAIDGGATWLGVATPGEAAALASDVDASVPVLLLSEPDGEALRVAWPRRPAGLRCTVATPDGIAVVESLVGDGDPMPVHVLVDTGMHRAGCDPSDASALLDRVVGSSALRLEGVWSHFAVADDPDDPFTAIQTRRFDDCLETLGEAGHRPPIQHLCNSAGAIAHPDAHRDLVRLGIAMYGIAPSAALAGRVDLRPALRLTATVVGVRSVDAGESVSYGRHWYADRPTRVATIDIGYADGIRRSSPAADVEVLVRGRRAPMLGVVTMDQTMIAVDGDVTLGDEVVLIGGQGEATITAEEIAGRLGTIGYEIVTGLSPRVQRVAG